MQELPCRNDVCPSPSQVSRRALPRVSVRSFAPWYGVAGSCRFPTTRMVFALSGAVGFGGTVRFGCHCWQSNSDAADQRPNIGKRFTQEAVVARIVGSDGPTFESLHPIVRFESERLV